MENTIKIPALRFTEFKGEWETKKVGELCDSIVPGRNKPTSFEGTIPWITTPDIQHNGTITFSKSGLNISREEAKRVGSKIVPINSIVIACVGELGLAAITGKEIVINQQLHAFIPQSEINYRFLLYQVSLQKKYMDRVATKTAVPYMNKDNCNAIPITFPTLPEQQKIASFFTAIDDKIQALKKKKSLLEQYKQGIMQQLFTQQLRFKDDNGEDYPDWEEKKLGEVYSFKITNSFSREQLNYEDGTVKNIHYGDIHTKFQTLFDITKESVPFINSEIFIGRISEDNYCKEGDLILADASEDLNDVGKSIELVNLNNEKLLSGLHTILARPDLEKLSIGFGGYLFKSTFVRTQIQKVSQGSKVLSISATRLSKLLLSFPCVKEQTKIANFLTSIDDKINKVQTQINESTQWKKGLLQKMFC
ncbi:restriction endonuclease subunit S [Parasediminibacterium sp. JCM 36343]|uniref:restriction endonuclease subunit S n=1 Tax=Parasediminibacterium sp. JCM 36343 TaxID=3374279 RepID=UPI00397A4395